MKSVERVHVPIGGARGGRDVDMEMGRRLLRPAEAARMLAISRPQIYRLATSGAIRAVRIAGSVRIPAEEIERVIQFGTGEGATK